MSDSEDIPEDEASLDISLDVDTCEDDGSDDISVDGLGEAGWLSMEEELIFEQEARDAVMVETILEEEEDREEALMECEQAREAAEVETFLEVEAAAGEALMECEPSTQLAVRPTSLRRALQTARIPGLSRPRSGHETCHRLTNAIKNLPAEASRAEIEFAFKKAGRWCHPDKGGTDALLQCASWHRDRRLWMIAETDEEDPHEAFGLPPSAGCAAGLVVEGVQPIWEQGVWLRQQRERAARREEAERSRRTRILDDDDGADWWRRVRRRLNPRRTRRERPPPPRRVAPNIPPPPRRLRVTIPIPPPCTTCRLDPNLTVDAAFARVLAVTQEHPPTVATIRSCMEDSTMSTPQLTEALEVVAEEMAEAPTEPSAAVSEALATILETNQEMRETAAAEEEEAAAEEEACADAAEAAAAVADEEEESAEAHAEAAEEEAVETFLEKEAAAEEAERATPVVETVLSDSECEDEPDEPESRWVFHTPKPETRWVFHREDEEEEEEEEEEDEEEEEHHPHYPDVDPLGFNLPPAPDPPATDCMDTCRRFQAEMRRKGCTTVVCRNPPLPRIPPLPRYNRPTYAHTHRHTHPHHPQKTSDCVLVKRC